MARTAAWFVQQTLALLVALALAPLLWPLYLPPRLLYGRPPVTPPRAHLWRYLVAAFTEKPPPPGIALSTRLRLALELARVAIMAPVWGLAWYLDELLYGRQLRQVQLNEPLFEISAARSGSTQLAHYLEDDPHIAAPGALMGMAPFLWLWRIAPYTLGLYFNAERTRRTFLGMFSQAYLQRHEADPFRSETLDVLFYIQHVVGWSRLFGPGWIARDFSFGSRDEKNRELWERDFVSYVESLGRKTLLYRGPAPDGRPRQYFVKGHFLSAADALERRFPDARFLTVVRAPARRLQSELNFLIVAPEPLGMPPLPWAWLVEAFVKAEVAYCDLEMAFYTRPGARRCVVRFTDYARDLEGTMRKIYRECLDTDALPPHVPRVHTERKRTGYLVDRSLEQLQVDEAALEARLKDYIRWVEGS